MAIYFNLFLFSISDDVFSAAGGGDLEKLKRLIEGGEDVNQRRVGEWTPLMEAAAYGQADCVEWLIKNGAQLDLKDSDGNTALHWAAFKGHLEVMKRLVEAGQDVNQRDEDKRTPLMKAAEKGHTDCVQYLILNGAHVNLKDREGNTALKLAKRGTREEHDSTVKLLQAATPEGRTFTNKSLYVLYLFYCVHSTVFILVHYAKRSLTHCTGENGPMGSSMKK